MEYPLSYLTTLSPYLKGLLGVTHARGIPTCQRLSLPPMPIGGTFKPCLKPSLPRLILDAQPYAPDSIALGCPTVRTYAPSWAWWMALRDGLTRLILSVGFKPDTLRIGLGGGGGTKSDSKGT